MKIAMEMPLIMAKLLKKINRYIATYIGDRTTPQEADGEPVYGFLKDLTT